MEDSGDAEIHVLYFERFQPCQVWLGIVHKDFNLAEERKWEADTLFSILDLKLEGRGGDITRTHIQTMISRLDVTSRSRIPTLVKVVLVVCVAMGLVDHVQCANYTVGQGFVDAGNGYTWTNTVNGLLKPALLEDAYNQWASSVKVTAGDTLTFNYPLGSHTVFLVNTEVAFLNCDFTGAVQVSDGFPTTYTVKSTDSTLYFVCNIPGHCLQGGQRVKVTTVGTGTLAPPSGPASNYAPRQSSLNGVTSAVLLIMSSVYLASALIL